MTVEENGTGEASAQAEWGLGFGIWELGVGVWGLGFGVRGFTL